MPTKINMFLSNGNMVPPQPQIKNNFANLATTSVPSVKSPPTALTAPIIKRIHNVQPGCGSCGRH